MQTRFLLITPGRSGSTHLRETLNTIEGLLLKDELFNRANEELDSFHHYINKKWHRKIIGFVSNRESISTNSMNFTLSGLVQGFLNDFLNVNSVQDVLGFTVSLDQWYAYPQIHTHIKDWKLIYLTRKDLLRLSLSLMKARSDGNYEIPDGKTIALDPEMVKHHVDLFEEWERDFLEGVKPDLILYYEELFNDYSGNIKKIGDSLELGPVEFSVSNLQQVNPKDTSQWVSNFDEIKAYLSKTS